MEDQPSLNPNPPSPPAKKPVKFGLSIVIVVICLIAAGLAVYWILTEPIEQPLANVVERKAADSTASWQTYRNEEYGFEVRYPSYFSTSYNDSFENSSDDINNVIFSRGPNLFCQDYPNCADIVNSPLSQWGFGGDAGDAHPLHFGITVIKKNKYKKEIIIDPDTAKQAKPKEIKNIAISGSDTKDEIYKLFAVEGAYDIRHRIELLNEDNNYVFEFIYTIAGCGVKAEDLKIPCDREMADFVVFNEDLIDQILSTFKFSKLVDASNWQTYRNEEYGFEVKYPWDWGLEILSDVHSPYTEGVDIIQPYSKIYETGSYVGKDLKFLIVTAPSINIDSIIKDNKAEEINLGNVIGWRYERKISSPETMTLIEGVILICDKEYCIEVSELGNYGPSDYDSRSEKLETIFSTFKFTK